MIPKESLNPLNQRGCRTPVTCRPLRSRVGPGEEQAEGALAALLDLVPPYSFLPSGSGRRIPAWPGAAYSPLRALPSSHTRAHCVPAAALGAWRERPCGQDGDTGRGVSQSHCGSWAWVSARSVLAQAGFCASVVVERWRCSRSRGREGQMRS